MTERIIKDDDGDEISFNTDTLENEMMITLDPGRTPSYNYTADQAEVMANVILELVKECREHDKDGE